jgi:hypothetical protein
MGQILDSRNLESYIRKCKKGTAPGWPVDELLYIRLPVLAVRNYLNDGSNSNWTLTWKKGRNMRMAFQIAGAILTQWQAFRPRPPKKLLRRLEHSFPRTMSRFQRAMLKGKIRALVDVKHAGIRCDVLLIEMGLAIAQVSRHKGVSNPMLGSKLLHFFFPEFFPIWDTAWIKKKALKHYTEISLPPAVEKRLSRVPQSEAALEYAKYVYLLLKEVWGTKPSQLRKLENLCFRYCKKKGYYEPQVVIQDNYRDITPLLFEMCLLGKHC